MSAATLIHEAEKDGLRFALTPSRTVKLTGPKDAAEKWAPRLREHKAEIVESLAALGSNAVDAEPIHGYTYDPEEAARFWQNLTARVDECDRLIHQLCDPRNDTSEHRIDLLAVCKTMAPNNLVGDIAYLKTAIAAVERPRRAGSFTPRGSDAFMRKQPTKAQSPTHTERKSKVQREQALMSMPTVTGKKCDDPRSTRKRWRLTSQLN